MLTYLGQGKRRYDLSPVTIASRSYWEFQAVFDGIIGLTRPDKSIRFGSRRLWIFPPHHLHGWSGKKGKEAEIAVFHYLSVPESLRVITERQGFLEIPLSIAQCRHIRSLAVKCTRYRKKAGPSMMLCFEHTLLDLCILACDIFSDVSSQNNETDSRKWVDAAMDWYGQRMAENPSLDEVSAAVGFSSSYLRKMFWDSLQCSPKQMFDQMRFQRAMQLMVESNLKLETVAAACGFKSASVFSRAFKEKFRIPPCQWNLKIRDSA